MTFVQSIDMVRAERIGPHGVVREAFEEALARSAQALQALRRRHADASLRLLRVPAERGDLAVIGEAAKRLTAGASDLVFLGTGGSSLGAQALVQLADWGVPGLGLLRAGPRAHFMDNLDPLTFGRLLERLPLATTRFVAISKSGGTGETLMQTAAVLAALKAAGLEKRIGEVFSRPERARQGWPPQRASRIARARAGALSRSRHRRRRAFLGAHQCRAAAGGDV
ncbi:MAG: hypothetical protein M5U33_02175 [Pseudorhodoplanes sp.]|nr:hypothetical protein [Pseudorhodoplanes sp.]